MIGSIINPRKLNENYSVYKYPIPNIYKYLQQIGGSTIFSQMNMNKRYYQILLNEKDTYKTAFSKCTSQYEFLINHSVGQLSLTFQKTMQLLFNQLNYVKIYLNDLLIHLSNKSDHESHLKTALDRLHRKISLLILKNLSYIKNS